MGKATDCDFPILGEMTDGMTAAAVTRKVSALKGACKNENYPEFCFQKRRWTMVPLNSVMSTLAWAIREGGNDAIFSLSTARSAK